MINLKSIDTLIHNAYQDNAIAAPSVNTNLEEFYRHSEMILIFLLKVRVFN